MKIFYPGKPHELDSKSNLFQERSQDPEWVAEPKWNGWRAFLITDEHANITAYSSDGTKLSYFKGEGLHFPPNSYFDCEWVDRRTTSVKNKLIVFGILQFKGKLLEGPERIRRAILEDLFSKKEELSEIQITSTGIVEVSLVERFYDNFLEHFQEVKNDTTIEGLVLKKESAPLEISYKGQFKSFTQIKVKK